MKNNTYPGDKWPESKPDPFTYVIYGIIIAFLSFIGWAVYEDSTHYETRDMGAIVMEHYVTANKSGARTYSTIIKTDDGHIEELTGLSSFAVKEGGRLRVKVRREIIK